MPVDRLAREPALAAEIDGQGETASGITRYGYIAHLPCRTGEVHAVGWTGCGCAGSSVLRHHRAEFVDAPDERSRVGGCRRALLPSLPLRTPHLKRTGRV